MSPTRPATIRTPQSPTKRSSRNAQEAAKNADVAVVFVGITDAMESEGMDRRTLSMPKNHEALVKAVSEVQKNTVVVVMCGGCITMPWIDAVRGVLYAYLGGEAVGTATLDLLFGDVNPSGKLAETFPRRLEDNPSYLYFFGDEQNKTEYREGVFVGYRYYDKKNMDVLFPFGYGLSYTTFAYSNPTVKQENGEVIATINVQNTGALDGDEVVQLYMSLPSSLRVRPIHALKAFKRVHIQAGETVTVTLNFKIDDLAVWCNGRKIYTVESGVYKMEVGAASDDIRLTPTWRLQAKRSRADRASSSRKPSMPMITAASRSSRISATAKRMWKRRISAASSYIRTWISPAATRSSAP